MAFKDCIDEIVAASGDLLTKDQATELLERIELRKRARLAKGNLDGLEDAIREEMEEAVEDLRMQQLVEKRSAALNVIKRLEFDQYVSNFDSDFDGLTAYMAGINAPAKGSRDSVASRQKAIHMKMFGGVVTDLEEKGVMKAFSSREHSDDIVRELYAMDMTGRSGSATGNNEAATIARVLKKWQDYSVRRQNDAGAWIKKLPGYIVRQNHDPGKMRRAGFETWRDKVLPLLDEEKTFKNLAPEEVPGFMESAYKALVSGLHMKPSGGQEADALRGFVGVKSLGKKVSEHRVIHFKDADGWIDYNKEFGRGSFEDAYLSGIERAALNVGLMEKMGPNPEMFYKNALDRLRKKNRDNQEVLELLDGKRLSQQYLFQAGNVKELVEVAGKAVFKGERVESAPMLQVKPDHLFAEISGATRAADNLSLAKLGAGVRAWNNIAHLGMATISSITDVPAKAGELRFQGDHPLSGYANAVKSLFFGLSDEETKRSARSLGVGFEGMVTDLSRRFSVEEDLPGWASNIQKLFFRLNGLNWWTDSQKSGAALHMSNRLASFSGQRLSDVQPELQRMLRNFNITDQDWDLMRKNVMTRSDGVQLIIPEAVREIPDADVRAVLGDGASSRQISKYREELEDKFRAYFTDRADFSVITPGTTESAILKQGTSPGTGEGEFLRFLGQFKSFPIAVWNRSIGRDLMGAAKPDIFGVVSYITGATILGYMALSMKDIARGKEPRSLEKPETILQAMLQGGGMGIYGDFLFGEFNKYGNSVLATAMGPTAAKGEDLVKIWASFVRNDDAGTKAAKFIMRNFPGNNLFYTRFALDYMILYSLQEQMSPGYLRRSEKRLKREFDQEYFIPPSTVVEPGNPLESASNTLEALLDGG